MLAGLQLGAVGAGPEHGDAFRPQPIGQAGRQRRFRAHHHQLDGVGAAGIHQVALVGFRDRQLDHALQIGAAAVPRRHPHAADAVAARQRPGQGVLAATTAHHQHVGGA